MEVISSFSYIIKTQIPNSQLASLPQESLSHIKLESKVYFFLLAFPDIILNTILLSKEKENGSDPKTENLITHI